MSTSSKNVFPQFAKNTMQGSTADRIRSESHQIVVDRLKKQLEERDAYVAELKTTIEDTEARNKRQRAHELRVFADFVLDHHAVEELPPALVELIADDLERRIAEATVTTPDKAEK